MLVGGVFLVRSTVLVSLRLVQSYFRSNMTLSAPHSKSSATTLSAVNNSKIIVDGIRGNICGL
jgi:hypothetical protein